MVLCVSRGVLQTAAIRDYGVVVFSMQSERKHFCMKLHFALLVFFFQHVCVLFWFVVLIQYLQQ